jgi:hypothetical protein
MTRLPSPPPGEPPSLESIDAVGERAPGRRFVVGVFLGDSFAEARRRYRSFPWEEPGSYADSIREIIAVAAGAGAAVQVTVIEPDALERWCRQEGLDPDDGTARARYAVLGGGRSLSPDDALTALRPPTP